MAGTVVGGDVCKPKSRRTSVMRFTVRRTSPEEQRQWKKVYATFVVDFFFTETSQTGRQLDDAVEALWEEHIKGKYTLETEIGMGPVRAVPLSF